MKNNLVILISALMLVSCTDEESLNSGHAPTYSNIVEKRLHIDVVPFDFTFHSNSTTVSINSYGSALNYSFSNVTEKPSVEYKKNSSNSSTFKGSVPYYFKGFSGISSPSYETSVFNFTLFFISPNEGYASGYMDGNSYSNLEFILL